MNKEGLPLDQILQGDCLDILPNLPTQSIDLIFADPPYNLQLDRELRRPDTSKVNGVNETWDKFRNFDDYDKFTYSWLNACRRVLKESGTIWVIGSYHNIFRVGKILQDLDFWILNDIVWIKNNPMPNFHGVRFTNAHETLIWAQKHKGSKYTFNYHAMKLLNVSEDTNNGLQMRSDWKLPLCTGKERIKVNGEKAHPTQKPEALLQRVILSSTNIGDTILDPFFGSGTTGAVAKRLGRHWIGIELENRYISIARSRIDIISPDKIMQFAHSQENKKLKRIPFQAIVKAGYIHEGEVLSFGNDESIHACILPDGNIRYQEITGSIHQVGREIRNAPCNGWLAWYYINQKTGEREPIDFLRQKMRLDHESSGDCC